jgi:PAS domain S-box-containing protein
MRDTPINLPEIHELLQQLLNGGYEPVSEAVYADSASRSLIQTLNAVHDQKESLVQAYNDDLQRSEARLRRIIESTPVGICITDENGAYEYVNPTYCRLYGYREDELLGNSFTIVVPEEHKDELTRLHAEFMGRRYELRGEWLVVRKDGSLMSILADAAYIIDVDGRPKKVTFVLDITERKRSEELLRNTVLQLNSEIERRTQLEKTKNEVERMIRHDLRNPLNGIMAAAEILMIDEINDEQRELCVVIREAGGKLNSMLSSSMDLIRMEAGNYVLNAESIDLTSVLREVHREMGPLSNSHGVTIQFLLGDAQLDWAAELPMEGERLYVADLFANVIRNAVEGSDRGDVVTVQIQAGDEYQVTTHNTGAVPEDIRDNFFERYATSGKKNGTGLGTYVAALITGAHNGRIEFNTSDADGTTVVVTLPRLQPRQSSA